MDASRTLLLVSTGHGATAQLWVNEVSPRVEVIVERDGEASAAYRGHDIGVAARTVMKATGSRDPLLWHLARRPQVLARNIPPRTARGLADLLGV